MYKVLLVILALSSFLFAEIKKEYYLNGILKNETSYKNGKKDGLKKVYYKTGQLKLEQLFKNGKARGIKKTYYKSGELEYLVPFINGIENGIVKVYYKTGELKQETSIVEGKVDGLMKTYFKSGTPETEINYKNGKMEGIGIRYYESGNILSKAFFNNEKIDGTAKAYYETGELERISIYRKGVLNGIQKYYLKSGELKKEVLYKYGEKDNTQAIIDKKEKLKRTLQLSADSHVIEEKDVYIKNYDDLVKATKNLSKPLDQRWLFVDKNNKIVFDNNIKLKEYFSKYFYFMLNNKVKILNKNIPSKSMKNTIYLNENIFIFKGLNSIFRGGVFAFYYPKDKKSIYVKRCVAIGGDILFLKDKSLYIHPVEGNEYVKENYNGYEIKNIDNKLFIKDPYKKRHQGIHNDLTIKNESRISVQQLFNMNKITISENECFMMGDNRDHSNDSRFWGSVSQELIIGVTIPIILKPH